MFPTHQASEVEGRFGKVGGGNWQLFKSQFHGREWKSFPETLNIYIVPVIFPVLPPVRSDT